MGKIMQRLVLFLVMLIALAGCGDLLGTKVVKKEIDTSRFRADCDLNVERFSLILHEPIGADIRCLGANLNLFITIVENERPGVMSRKAFEAYLKNYRSDEINPDVINALKAVYDLNYLLTGDDPEYISRESVSKIINLALVFNEEAYKYFAKTFQDEDAVSYNIHQYQRTQVEQAAVRIMTALDIVHQDGQKLRKLNIIDLLSAFTTDATRPSIEKIKEVLFAKTVLLGGEKEVITHTELKKLIRHFPEFTVLALDGVRAKYIDLNQRTLISLIKKNVNSLAKIIFKYGDRSGEDFFTIDEAMDVVKMFVSAEKFDIEKYRKLVVEGKQVLMGGNATMITGADFKKLVDHAEKILQTGEAFHRMYDYFLVPLESKLGPLAISFEQHRDVFYDVQTEFRKFIRIVKDYRFMTGEFEAPYYSREWWRNADGVFEIYLYEYLVEQVFSYSRIGPDGKPENWGIPGSATGEFSHKVDQPKLEKLILRFSNELVSMGLILPGRAVSISDTISLLGTLFQNQSSMVHEDVPMLDVNETSEFVLTLISGTNMANDLMADFRKNCSNSMDGYDRIEPKCFRENYFKSFCRKYKRNFPLLFKDIGGEKSCDNIVMNEYNNQYLQYSIEAARNCNYYHDGKWNNTTEEIYYSEDDIMSIMVAMMHIEATMIRWDKNRNNQWDPDEADMAYSVYSTALDGFLLDKPAIIKKLKKKIYLYLLKNEDVPKEDSFGGILKFVKFLVSFNQKSGASRKTMAAVLRAIGNENIKTRLNKGEKPWDCNLMRYPDRIPLDYDPNKPTNP